jgi:hypothetical protein
VSQGARRQELIGGTPPVVKGKKDDCW